MASDSTPAPHVTTRQRFVIDYSTGTPGPCLVVLAGLHGDERGTVVAVERVRDALESQRPSLCGRVVIALGNLPALAAGKRYLEEDLNRNWYEDELAKLLASDPAADSSEDAQRRELGKFINSLESERNFPVVFLDLHSTSADGLPFCCMPDTLNNLKIALELPFPAILGLEDSIRGPLAGILSDRGFAGVIVEGGQHTDPRTVDILEATVWALLVRLGLLRRNDTPDYDDHWRRLRRAGRDLPRVLEISYQHETAAEDGFVMEPGFEHYDRVDKGQLIARDNKGDIRARTKARILMPAYKPGTDQGFFIARDIAWFRVKFLFLIRTLGIGNMVHWLPGTTRYGVHPNFLRIANWVPRRFVKVIRLLGWRRTYQNPEHMILRRRRVRKRSRVGATR